MSAHHRAVGCGGIEVALHQIDARVAARAVLAGLVPAIWLPTFGFAARAGGLPVAAASGQARLDLPEPWRSHVDTSLVLIDHLEARITQIVKGLPPLGIRSMVCPASRRIRSGGT